VTEGTVYDLAASGNPAFQSMTNFLLHTEDYSPESRVALVAEAVKMGLPTFKWADLDRAPSAETAHLLAPIDLQEVWASGVTYLISRDAREEESGQSNIYNRVYDAERPELFFKATPHRVVGHRDFVFVRSDSNWSVPEPELALFIAPNMEIIGFTIGNDVSSRNIEGENPLYLPQAKVYVGSCALGPAVLLAEPGEEEPRFPIRLTITRGAEIVFRGETSTAQMKRSFADLVHYLGRANTFPGGAILLTGTGIVPPDDFTLQDGDEVAIAVEGVGVLRNIVALAHLSNV